jgi:hypothetical protein
MAADPTEEVRARLGALRAQTAEREAKIEEDQFLGLPQKLQNQLAVLQAQSEPSSQTYEALLAAEHNLQAYKARLDQALGLVAQMKGAKMRRRRARGHALGRWLLTLVVLGVLAAGGYVALYQVVLPKKAATCEASPACRAEGRCGAGLRVDPPLVELVCQAATDDHCRAGSRCKSHAECYVERGRCVARDAKDCASTEACRVDGQCKPVDGRCQAVAREDCARTPGCQERGECSPSQGICAALSDEDCKHSVACKRYGACTEVQGKCVKLEE